MNIALELALLVLFVSGASARPFSTKDEADFEKMFKVLDALGLRDVLWACDVGPADNHIRNVVPSN